MDKLVSIIVLTYNNSNYLVECLESIYSQSYENIEIIISDDGSNSNNKVNLIEITKNNKWKKFKKIITIMNNNNVGVVKNYNIALKCTSGEYIIYLAADDVLYDYDVIKDIVCFFETTGELIFTGYKDVYDETLNTYIRTLPRKNEVDILKENNSKLLYESLCKGSFISGSNTPFARKLIEENGYLDESYFYLEDYPRYLSLTRKGYNIGFYDRKLIKYRLGGVTTTGGINENLRLDLKLSTLKECYEYFNEKWDYSWLNKKKIVGWGTGDCFINSYERLGIKFKYLVDSNKKVQGNRLDNYEIKAPENLKFELKNEIFIFIFSYANYFDISAELEGYGYKEFENFFICTPNILDIVMGEV